MKNLLILVRHGHYYDDAEGELSSRGRQQMDSLAEKIRPLLTAHLKIVVLTSSATRATQSARVLCEALGLESREHSLLWSENRRPPDYDAAKVLISEAGKEADVTIVVTHMEYAEGLPGLFHHPLRRRGVGIENGQAWIIDTKTWQMDLVDGNAD